VPRLPRASALPGFLPGFLPCLLAGVAALSPAEARAVPTQTIVFLNSNQRIKEGYPQLALFSYYYARPGLAVLGIYAGPRWTFGNFGVEFKTGAYGGGSLDAHAIINNQLDYTSKYLSITSFTDWYPRAEIYTYLSAYAVLGPLYLGGVGDYDQIWAPAEAALKSYGGGPAIGVGTRAMYLATSLIFKNDHTRAIRLTIGLTF
jgi:hypothetical protein